MKAMVVRASFAIALGLWVMVLRAETMVTVRLRSGAATARQVPSLLSETGLYLADGVTIDPRNQPFTPQYPLWSDGAQKRRWIQLPDGKSIDTRNIDHWDFPIGTKFWKEFSFGGRRVETRFLWKVESNQWLFASYAWNDGQTEAVLAPEAGIPNVAEVAPGKRHSIPGVADCRSCHDSTRTEILGFTALQLSDDRDPLAPHAEVLMPDMITLRTLVAEERLVPSRREWIATPPRVAADDPQARAALGYLSTNCGSCHNPNSSIASLGLFLKYRLADDRPAALATGLNRTGHWIVPTAPTEDDSKIIHPGRADLSAIIARASSRRGASQMPPIGTVVADRQAVDLLTSWVNAMKRP